jgi:hypothetical protein
VPNVINFYARVLFADAVDDAIPPYSIGPVTVEFAGKFCTHVGFSQQCLYGRSDEPLDFRR